MTIRHLEIFLAVYDSLSMTQAAKKLFITQPTVSQAIAELEANYGVRLFNRISNRLSATSDAEKMRIYAVNMISALAALEKDMGEKKQAITLPVGASVTIGETFFFNLVKGFLVQNPAYRISSIVNNAPFIENAIVDNQLKVAIITSATVIHPKLTAVPLYTDDLVLVAHQSYPIKNEKALHAADLSGFPLLLREEGSRIRQVIEELDIPLEIAGEHNNANAILKAISNNLGVSVMPKAFIVSSEHNNLQYLPIIHPDFNVKYWVIYKKENASDPSIQIFTQYCLKFIKSLDS